VPLLSNYHWQVKLRCNKKSPIQLACISEALKGLTGAIVPHTGKAAIKFPLTGTNSFLTMLLLNPGSK